MEKIKKILEIKDENFFKITEFIDSFVFDETNFSVTTNDTIFCDESYPINKNHLVPIEKSTIFNFHSEELNQYFINAVNYLKSNFKLKVLWLMIYPPKTKIHFHIDRGDKRHVITFNENPRFFSYECDEKHGGKIDTLNNKLTELLTNIDEFNNFFVNFSEDCKISTLEKNCVYTFGDTVHNFINDSDKLRVNFVFELMN
jgi:hypothetical protein